MYRWLWLNKRRDSLREQEDIGCSLQPHLALTAWIFGTWACPRPAKYIFEEQYIHQFIAPYHFIGHTVDYGMRAMRWLIHYGTVQVAPNSELLSPDGALGYIDA